MNIDFVIVDGVLKEYRGIRDVVVPNDVKYIDSSAFKRTNICEISLPENVELADDAFLQCSFLTKVEFRGNAVFQANAFSGCDRLRTIIAPEQTIKSVLNSFPERVEFYTPDGTQILSDAQKAILIDGDVFRKCSKYAESYEVPEGVRVIGKEAFRNCKRLVELKLPETLEIIEKSAFDGCTNLSKLKLPESLKVIEKWAFAECTSLVELKLPESLEVIGNFAFRNLRIKELVIPDKVKQVKSDAFSYCPELETVSFPYDISIEEGISDCPKLKTLIFRGNIERFDSWIWHCPAFNRVITTEKGMKYLSKKIHSSRVKYFAADGTPLLTEEQQKKIKEREEKKEASQAAAAKVQKSSSKDKDLLKGINKDARTILLPDEMVAIPKEVFKDCTKLEKVVFGKGILSVEAKAFAGCTALKCITLNENLTSIASTAFQKCTELVFVVGPAKALEVAKLSIPAPDKKTFFELPQSKNSDEKTLFEKIAQEVSLSDLVIWENGDSAKIKYAKTGKPASPLLLAYIRYAYMTQVPSLPGCNKNNYDMQTVPLKRSALADEIAVSIDHKSLMDALKRYVPTFYLCSSPYEMSYADPKKEQKSFVDTAALRKLLAKAKKLADDTRYEQFMWHYDKSGVIHMPQDIIPYCRYADPEELAAVKNSFEMWADGSLFNAPDANKADKLELAALAKAGRQTVVLARSAMLLNNAAPKEESAFSIDL